MSNNITTLRETLFATIEGIRNKTIDLDTARAINEVSKTVVDTARVEVDFIRATGQAEATSFLTPEEPKLPEPPAKPAELPNGITSITRHHLRG